MESSKIFYSLKKTFFLNHIKCICFIWKRASQPIKTLSKFLKNYFLNNLAKIKIKKTIKKAIAKNPKIIISKNSNLSKIGLFDAILKNKAKKKSAEKIIKSRTAILNLYLLKIPFALVRLETFLETTFFLATFFFTINH